MRRRLSVDLLHGADLHDVALLPRWANLLWASLSIQVPRVHALRVWRQFVRWLGHVREGVSVDPRPPLALAPRRIAHAFESRSACERVISATTTSLLLALAALGV